MGSHLRDSGEEPYGAIVEMVIRCLESDVAEVLTTDNVETAKSLTPTISDAVIHVGMLITERLPHAAAPVTLSDMQQLESEFS